MGKTSKYVTIDTKESFVVQKLDFIVLKNDTKKTEHAFFFSQNDT